VKLVLDEPGAEVTQAWFTQAEQACSGVATCPEVTSALCRQDRERGEVDGRGAWLETLETSRRRCVHVPVFERSAARLAVRHSLRGMDAVQLASASELQARVLAETSGAAFHFMAFDRRLLEAAEREGFATPGGPLE